MERSLDYGVSIRAYQLICVYISTSLLSLAHDRNTEKDSKFLLHPSFISIHEQKPGNGVIMYEIFLSTELFKSA